MILDTSGKSASKLEAVRGKVIVSAVSSLQNFSIELADGIGLRIDAVQDEDECRLTATVVDAASLPKSADAVCSVDWKWIYGASVKHVAISGSALRFELDPVGPLAVSAGTWQGKPFLSFQPFKAPARQPS